MRGNHVPRPGSLYGEMFGVIGDAERLVAGCESRIPPSGRVKEALMELTELGRRSDPGSVHNDLALCASAWRRHGSDDRTSQSTRGV